MSEQCLWAVRLTIEVTAIVNALPEWSKEEVTEIAEGAGWEARAGHPDVRFQVEWVEVDKEASPLRHR